MKIVIKNSWNQDIIPISQGSSIWRQLSPLVDPLPVTTKKVVIKHSRVWIEFYSKLDVTPIKTNPLLIPTDKLKKNWVSATPIPVTTRIKMAPTFSRKIQPDPEPHLLLPQEDNLEHVLLYIPLLYQHRFLLKVPDLVNIGMNIALEKKNQFSISKFSNFTEILSTQY